MKPDPPIIRVNRYGYPVELATATYKSPYPPPPKPKPAKKGKRHAG